MKSTAFLHSSSSYHWLYHVSPPAGTRPLPPRQPIESSTRHGTLRHATSHYVTLRYVTLRYGTVRCGAVRCGRIFCRSSQVKSSRVNASHLSTGLGTLPLLLGGDGVGLLGLVSQPEVVLCGGGDALVHLSGSAQSGIWQKQKQCGAKPPANAFSGVKTLTISHDSSGSSGINDDGCWL